MSEENIDKPYNILVHHPNGEGPTMKYRYVDLDSAVEGIATIALTHVKERLGIRRLFEIVPAPEEPKKEEKEECEDSNSSSEPSSSSESSSS